MLIEHCADINARANAGCAPLHRTVMGAYNDKKLGIMWLLLKNGADVNARNDTSSTPLLLVASKGNFEAVSLLLKHGASIHVRNW